MVDEEDLILVVLKGRLPRLSRGLLDVPSKPRFDGAHHLFLIG
jgi:hypothetical protein